MKKELILLFFVLCSLTVSALDLTGSKYSSDIYKIKFDDNPNILVFNKSLGTNYGCGADGRFFVKFDVNSGIHDISKIQLYYRLYNIADYDRELTGEYYKRNLQTGKFENISKLFNSMTYYFFSDTLFTNNNYIIKTDNLDGQNKEKIFYIHCPESRYTCSDIKPIMECYNTNDEKLVIEFSGMNINENEEFNLSDLQIYTKGTNQRSNLLDNTLSSDARMEKIGNDKYRVISSLLYGNPKAGTNIINYIYLQPKNCIYDLYPEAYVAQKCSGIKEVSSLELPNAITGAAVVSETSIGSNYWVYGLVILALVIIMYLFLRKKKHQEL